MATRKKHEPRVEENKNVHVPHEESQKVDEISRPRCLGIAQRGIRSGGQFAEMMSALMSDLIEGKITPQVGNATVNAGGKLLKVVEMQFKYGTTNPDGSTKVLNLIQQ